MRFLSPKNDFVFKKIFGSPESKDILISLLNALIYHNQPTIKDLEILDPYSPSKLALLKESYLDVKAVLDNGKKVIIEMQIIRVDSFEKRIVYNLAKTYANQLKSGESYYNLNPVIALTITDFILFPESKKVINEFVFKEKEANFSYPRGNIEMIFVELPKFEQELDDLATLADKWIYLIKNTADLTKIPPQLTEISELEKALNLANEANLTPEELEEVERKETWQRDEMGRLIEAKNEGKEEEKRQIALNLLKYGMSAEEVLNCTNLSLDVIKLLKNEIEQG